MSRPKTTFAALLIGASTPFLMGADGDLPSPAHLEFWSEVAELVASGVVTAFVVAVAAGLKRWGKSKLSDKDPSNDGAGEFAVGAGEALEDKAKDGEQ